MSERQRNKRHPVDHRYGPVTERVANNVRTLRKSNHMAAKDLAICTGLPLDMIYKLETGVRTISVEELMKLATALDVPPGSLMTHDYKVR